MSTRKIVTVGLLAAIIVSAQSSTGLIIQGDGISYLGWRDPTCGLDNFLGIPFAQPPLGSLRFRPPQPWRPTDGTNLVNATLYSPSCEQDSSNFPNTSEDCLTLDIYKPTNTNGKLPVMVWIYGGGWTTGGTTALYSGFNLVPTSVRLGKPIIYVAINYRVGTYGFPPGQAAADAGILNLGLKDQRLALEWVQNNIGYFGGDPTKVTIFGNSAGSISCGFQSLYNGGDIGGAFRSMILESGSPANAQIRRPNAPPLETAYQVLLNLTQCTNATDSYECLRNAPAELLKQANQEAVKPPPSSQSADSLASIGPVVYEGDASLPEQPSELLKAGKFAKIPFINGAQLDEGTIFVNESYPETEQDILDLLTDPAASFGLTNITAARQLISYYPADPSAGSPYGTGNETFGFAAQFKRLASIVGDFIFQANRRVHLQTAIHHGVPSWYD